MELRPASDNVGRLQMSAGKSNSATHSVWGWFCILLGLYPIAASLGVLPLNDDAVFVPVWVLFLCGVPFVCSGVMILRGQRAAINDLLAMVFCMAAGIVGAWIAIFGSSEQMSSGLPFISRELSVILARIAFGLGALITFAVAVHAYRCYRRRR